MTVNLSIRRSGDRSGDPYQVAFKEDGGVDVNDEMSTNVPGVFAIGDIRNTPYKQVVVAASDGCVAAMAIDRYLKGNEVAIRLPS